MAQEPRELVVLVTRGTDHELSSVAFTIACEDFIEGVTIAGASVIHERFKAGAASLSF